MLHTTPHISQLLARHIYKSGFLIRRQKSIMVYRCLLLVLVAGCFVMDVSAFLWDRSSSKSLTQQTHHFSTNNCMCLNRLFQMMGGLGSNGFSGRREVAAILDLDEDYPGFEEFLDHADTKRDGTVDNKVLKEAIRQAGSMPSQSNSPNMCHCGRNVIDHFRREL